MATHHPQEDFDFDPTLPHLFPELPQLHAGLSKVLEQAGLPRLESILDRHVNDYSSSLPTEIVTCQLADGSQRKLFCKYTIIKKHAGTSLSDASEKDSKLPHASSLAEDDSRRGVLYEAEVYRRILHGLPVTTPACYGVCWEAGADTPWLILEYIEGCCPVKMAPEGEGMPAAARWYGRFHALGEHRLHNESFPFLTTYDADYYRSWSRRALAYAQPLPRHLAWFEKVCRRYEDMIPLLTGQPQTIIHGECTPHNVLWKPAGIFPVDWESAAVAAGIIDLAILIRDWEDEVVQACLHNYLQARWPHPSSSILQLFTSSLGVARLYAALHWFSGGPGWAARDVMMSSLNELHEVAKSMGII